MAEETAGPVWVSHYDATHQQPYFWDLTAQCENRWEPPPLVSWQGPYSDESNQHQYYHNPSTGEKEWCSVLQQRRAAALQPSAGEEPFAPVGREEDASMAVTFSASGSLGVVFKPREELDRWYVARVKRKSQARTLGVVEELVLLTIDGEQIRCSSSPAIAAAIPATRPVTLTFQRQDAVGASEGGTLRSSLRQSRHESILVAEETGASPAKYKHWASMRDDERAAVEALGGTASTWQQGGMGAVFARQWEAMSQEEQRGASLLGYTEFDFGEQLASTAGKEKDWRQLSEEERSACIELGWTEATWMSGDDAVFDRSWEDLGPQRQQCAGLLGFDMYDFAENGEEPDQELGAALELKPEPEQIPEADESTTVDVSPRTIALRVRQRLASGTATPTAAHDSMPAAAAINRESELTGGKGFAVFDLLAQEARRISRGRLAWAVPEEADELDALFLSMDAASPSCITQAEFERGILAKVPKLRHSKKALRRAFKLSLSEQGVDSSGSAQVGSAALPREAFRRLLENAVFFDGMVALYRDMDAEGLDRVYKSSFVERCQTIGKRGKSGPSKAAIERSFAKIKAAGAAAAAQGVDGKQPKSTGSSAGEYIRAADFCEWAGLKRQKQHGGVSAPTASFELRGRMQAEDEQSYAAATDHDEVEELVAAAEGEEGPYTEADSDQTAETPRISFASREDAIKQLGELTRSAASSSDPASQWVDVRTLQWVQQHLAEEEEVMRQRLGAIPLNFRGGKTSVADVVEALFPTPTEAELFAEDVKILRQFYTSHPRGQEAAATWHVDTSGWGDAEWSEKVRDMARSFRKKSAATGKKKQHSSTVDRDFMYTSIASRWGVDPRFVSAEVAEKERILAHQASPRQMQRTRSRSRSASGPPPPMRPPAHKVSLALARVDGSGQGVAPEECTQEVGTELIADGDGTAGADAGRVAAEQGGGAACVQERQELLADTDVPLPPTTTAAAAKGEQSATGPAATEESDPAPVGTAAQGADIDPQGAVDVNEQPSSVATAAAPRLQIAPSAALAGNSAGTKAAGGSGGSGGGWLARLRCCVCAAPPVMAYHAQEDICDVTVGEPATGESASLPEGIPPDPGHP